MVASDQHSGNLTGENIDVDFEDPTYFTPERVLGMAQQNFGGEVLQTNDNTGVNIKRQTSNWRYPR